MPQSYKNTKVLGTSGLTTYTTLYNTTASTTAVISTIAVCNRSANNKQYRIGIDDSAGTPATNEFIAFDATVAANDTSFITVGVCLSNNQYIRVSSTDNTVTFSAFVSEII